IDEQDVTGLLVGLLFKEMPGLEEIGRGRGEGVIFPVGVTPEQPRPDEIGPLLQADSQGGPGFRPAAFVQTADGEAALRPEVIRLQAARALELGQGTPEVAAPILLLAGQERIQGTVRGQTFCAGRLAPGGRRLSQPVQVESAALVINTAWTLDLPGEGDEL